MFHGLRWRIAVPYVVLILVATLGLTLYVSNQVQQARLADLEAQLLADARLLADSVAPPLDSGEPAEALDALAKHWSSLLEARITIISPDGVVLGDSEADRTQMDNHLNRPEVEGALNTGHAGSTRFSKTVGYDMMYVAYAATAPDGEQVLGIVRVSLPLGEIEANVGLLRQNIVTAGLVTALLAALMALVIAERMARPIRRLTLVAERMAEGDLDARLVSTSRDEIGQLTQAFNHMADQLRVQVTNLAEERGSPGCHARPHGGRGTDH